MEVSPPIVGMHPKPESVAGRTSYRVRLVAVLAAISLLPFGAPRTAMATTRAAGDLKSQLELGKPPARCVNAIKKVNMDFDKSGPTYYFLYTIDSLAYCRPDDWVLAAKARISKSRTIEDYNYQRIPAIALAGKNLISLRTWMCDWMTRLRRENKFSEAYRVLLACGERPGTDTRKGVQVITTTSVSTNSTIRPPLPSVEIRPRQEYWAVSTSGKVIENGNGNVIKYCILLNGRDFYDVAESLRISDGKGNQMKNGPWCTERQDFPWPSENGQPGFTALPGVIADRYTDLSGCKQDATGRIAICETVKISWKFTFSNGREVISNSFPIYLRNLANRWDGETGVWARQFNWFICTDPVADGDWTSFCPSGAN